METGKPHHGAQARGGVYKRSWTRLLVEEEETHE